MKNFLEYLEENHPLQPRHMDHAIEDTHDHTNRSDTLTTNHKYGDHQYGKREAEDYMSAMHTSLHASGYRYEGGSTGFKKYKDKDSNHHVSVEHDGSGNVTTKSYH